MRACFLGQNICTLGFGVAILQTPPMVADEETGKSAPAEDMIAEKDAAPTPAAPTPPTAH